MANPRKFSEKIALHNQKMQEETAAFEKIMREVCDVKKVEDSTELATNIENDYSQNSGQLSSRESRGRNISVGGPIRSRPSSRNIDTSPYGGNCIYLSPPSDSSWRRTNSDSAIHKTYNQQNQDSLFYTTDMHSTHSLSTVNNSTAQRETTKNNNRTSEGAKSAYNLLDIRSRSATGIPCMPGINVYPSPHDKPSLQSGNTGSLPDLSRFPPSSQNPNGQEPQQINDGHSAQTNIDNVYSSNSPFLSPTGQLERHLPPDYIMLGINTDIKSPKDSSSQYASHCNVVPQNLSTFGTLYQDTTSMQKNKNEFSTISQHGSNENLIQQSMMNSRSPHRSSAGSSPRLATSFPSNMKYFGSAPSSPTSTILSNGENYEQKSDGFCENQSIHHDFAQFTLLDSIEHIGQSGNLANYNNQFQSISYLHDNNLAVEGNGTKNVVSAMLSDTMCLYDATHADLFNFSPTHLKKGCGNSTNIPDIEITDYSTGIVDFDRETVPNDLELGQMDIAGLQMLNDPNTNIITDPIIEDSFRRDIH